MNSRGTRVMWRIAVDTLDSRAAPAMMPRNHPAAAGTQLSRDRIRARLVVTVIGGQDIR